MTKKMAIQVPRAKTKQSIAMPTLAPVLSAWVFVELLVLGAAEERLAGVVVDVPSKVVDSALEEEPTEVDGLAELEVLAALGIEEESVARVREEDAMVDDCTGTVNDATSCAGAGASNLTLESESSQLATSSIPPQHIHDSDDVFYATNIQSMLAQSKWQLESLSELSVHPPR